jgi:hypothetical protein
MANVIIKPVLIDRETEKAVLVFQGMWLPKSQVVIRRGCVVALAGWLYVKHKKCFIYANCKTVEELEEWMDYEEEVAKMMAADPTVYRCERCGCLFRSETHQRMCQNCNLDYSIALGHTAKFGTMSAKEQCDAAIRGIIHKP